MVVHSVDSGGGEIVHDPLVIARDDLVAPRTDSRWNVMVFRQVLYSLPFRWIFGNISQNVITLSFGQLSSDLSAGLIRFT